MATTLVPNATAIAAGASASIDLGDVAVEGFQDDSGVIPLPDVATDGTGSNTTEGFQLFAPNRVITIEGEKIVASLSALRTFYNDIRFCQQNQDATGHTLTPTFTGVAVTVKIMLFTPDYVAAEGPLVLPYRITFLEVAV